MEIFVSNLHNEFYIVHYFHYHKHFLIFDNQNQNNFAYGIVHNDVYNLELHILYYHL